MEAGLKTVNVGTGRAIIPIGELSQTNCSISNLPSPCTVRYLPVPWPSSPPGVSSPPVGPAPVVPPAGGAPPPRPPPGDVLGNTQYMALLQVNGYLKGHIFFFFFFFFFFQIIIRVTPVLPDKVHNNLIMKDRFQDNTIIVMYNL